jgi:hypothetical protein
MSLPFCGDMLFSSCPSKEEFEYTKGVIRIRKSKIDRQPNGQKNKDQKDKKRSTIQRKLEI